jgi:hypothetical protein
MALNKRFVVLIRQEVNLVQVVDVAKSIIKAFELKESGQKNLFFANENLSFKEFHKSGFTSNQNNLNSNSLFSIAIHRRSFMMFAGSCKLVTF